MYSRPTAPSRAALTEQQLALLRERVRSGFYHRADVIDATARAMMNQTALT